MGKQIEPTPILLVNSACGSLVDRLAAAEVWHKVGVGTAIVIAYASLSLYDFRNLLVDLGSRVPNTPYSGDVGAAIWYMAWLPFALGHALNPFVSHFQFAPEGFNLLSNTGDFFPALVLSPVTALFGPVVSFNVAVIAAPATSAGALYFVVRRLGLSALAAFVAGALYGFSPYLMHEDPLGHLNLTWMFFPPLAYYLLYRILCVQAGSPYRDGVAMGVLVVAQFFTSTEILLDCALVAVPLVLLFALRRIHELRQRSEYALRALGTAGLVIVPLLAYPFWVDVAGPYHVLAGHPSPGAISLLSPLWPSAPSGANLLQRADSGFVGPGAVIVALLAVLSWRRVRNVAHFVAGAVLSYLLALGPFVKATGNDVVSHVWLWSAPDHLRLFKAIEDYRFSALFVMFVAMLVAVSIDRVGAAKLRLAKARSAEWWRSAAGVLGVGSVVLAFPLFADNISGATQDVSLPIAVARALPAGVTSPTLDLYPGASIIGGNPLIWQALSGMSFKLGSGYAFLPPTPTPKQSDPSSASPTAINIAFVAAALGKLPPHLSAGEIGALRAGLAHSDVSGVVIALDARDGLLLARNIVRAIGPPTYRSATFWAWSELH